MSTGVTHCGRGREREREKLLPQSKVLTKFGQAEIPHQLTKNTFSLTVSISPFQTKSYSHSQFTKVSDLGVLYAPCIDIHARHYPDI